MRGSLVLVGLAVVLAASPCSRAEEEALASFELTNVPLDDALARAGDAGKPLLVVFHAPG